MKQDIEHVLGQLVVDKLRGFDGEMFWNKRKKRFEIYGTIFVNNQKHISLVDVDEVTSSEDIVEFTDVICFYEEQEPITKEDFLAVFPFSRKKGIQKQQLLAVIDYFETLLLNGTDELIAFLKDDQKETFELVFEKKQLQPFLEKYKEEIEWITYPKF